MSFILFRVYSDSSHGYNATTGFAPAAALTSSGGVNNYRAPVSLVNMKEQLKIALMGKKNAPHNPFVFCTPSLLLALQFAHFRNGAGENRIRIACFDAAQVRTPHGDPVQFRCVNDVVREHDIQISDHHGGFIKYPAEYLTMDCIVLGDSARTADFQELLEDGLYRLYPAIQEANNNTRFAPRVNLELAKVRKFYFCTTTRGCSRARIDLAAKVASIFRANGRGEAKVATHVLAWILSLQKRDAVQLSEIMQWLQDYATQKPTTEPESQLCAFFVDTTTMPELQQFSIIFPLMRGLSIENSVLSAVTSIRAKDNEVEIMEWRNQQQVDNKEFQEERAKRNAEKAKVEKEKKAEKKAKDTEKKEAEAAKKKRVREREKKKRATEAEKKRKEKAKREKVKDDKEKKKISEQKKKDTQERKIKVLERKLALEKRKQVAK